MRIEGELHQLNLSLNEPRILQFAQLPGVTKPGGNVGFDLRLEFGIFQTALQIFAALFAQ